MTPEERRTYAEAVVAVESAERFARQSGNEIAAYAGIEGRTGRMVICLSEEELEGAELESTLITESREIAIVWLTEPSFVQRVSLAVEELDEAEEQGLAPREILRRADVVINLLKQWLSPARFVVLDEEE